MTLRTYLTSFLFLLLFSVGIPAQAQLSGTYTLGDAQSDYPSFSDAVAALRDEGLAGDVEFRVKPGTYHYVTVNDLSNENLYEILFVYDGTPGDSAVISDKLTVSRSAGVVFRGFFIHPAQNQITACVYSNASNYFTLDSCTVMNIYNCDFDYDEGMIKLEFPWDGAYIVNRITNCRIRSDKETFAFEGAKGSIWFRGNTITGRLVSSPAKNTTPFSMQFHYLDNIFYCTGGDFEQTGQEFIGNTFYFKSIFNLTIQGSIYYNTFYANVGARASHVIGNVFYGDLGMSWQNNSDVYYNEIHGKYSSIFSNGIKIANNIFYDNVDLNNDNTLFWNNRVYDTVNFSHGPGQFVYNNNFERNAYLLLQYTSGRLINNNLANLYIVEPQIQVWTIEGNNFVNGESGNVCCYGENAHFYNPLYDSVLRATNPLLTGKGSNFYPRFKYDLDSVLRDKPCTIGTNEICFNWQVGLLELSCADSLKLDLCLDSLAGTYWSPGYLFEDSTRPDPLIFPQEDVTVFLRNPDGSVVDSLQIRVLADKPTARATYEAEGFQVSFSNQSRCADEYFWDFGDGTTSSEESPVHTYAETGDYVCTLTAKSELGEDDFVMNILLSSIGENTAGASFRIYPNPARAGQQITVESPKEFTRLQVFDVFGECVLSQNTPPTRKFKLGTEHLPDGIYLLQIQTTKGVLTQSFIKLGR